MSTPDRQARAQRPRGQPVHPAAAAAPRSGRQLRGELGVDGSKTLLLTARAGGAEGAQWPQVHRWRSRNNRVVRMYRTSQARRDRQRAACKPRHGPCETLPLLACRQAGDVALRRSRRAPVCCSTLWPSLLLGQHCTCYRTPTKTCGVGRGNAETQSRDEARIAAAALRRPLAQRRLNCDPCCFLLTAPAHGALPPAPAPRPCSAASLGRASASCAAAAHA